ncbi:MAG: hypothetical protein BWZ10_01271 [candidate division BRC1 bacterium ADurb.BinA364]|nr:MAG: hypothetical protein BWZ10_01271 [candidate division BRC1 bacterium ADurb.BinA364]
MRRVQGPASNCSAIRAPASARRAASSGASSSRAMARASPGGSRCGTCTMARAPGSASKAPPAGVEITGTPQAIASRLHWGKPSTSLASANAFAAASSGAASGRWPRKAIRRATPRSAARASSRGRSGPSPPTASAASRPSACKSAMASIKSSTRLSGTSRPTVATRGRPAGPWLKNVSRAGSECPRAARSRSISIGTRTTALRPAPRPVHSVRAWRTASDTIRAREVNGQSVRSQAANRSSRRWP